MHNKMSIVNALNILVFSNIEVMLLFMTFIISLIVKILDFPKVSLYSFLLIYTIHIEAAILPYCHEANTCEWIFMSEEGRRKGTAFRRMTRIEHRDTNLRK